MLINGKDSFAINYSPDKRVWSLGQGTTARCGYSEGLGESQF